MPMKLQRRRSFLPTLSINTIAIRDPDNHNIVTNLHSEIHITEKSIEKKKEGGGEGKCYPRGLRFRQICWPCLMVLRHFWKR